MILDCTSTIGHCLIKYALTNKGPMRGSLRLSLVLDDSTLDNDGSLVGRHFAVLGATFLNRFDNVHPLNDLAKDDVLSTIQDIR